MPMIIGFSPLWAAGLSLIATTAPLAFSALGTPVIALATVTGPDLPELAGMIGRQLPFFSLIIPFWLIRTFVGFRKMIKVWPTLLVAGGSFALLQYGVPNFRGPWLVDVLAAIACMLALGHVTRHSGLDATLGLAFANIGWFYSVLGTLLGWPGVAVTGSDTASNVPFGGLQRVTATQLGLSPALMAAAYFSGGVMGKMIEAQSIVVASTATTWYGHEGSILRFVFFHSIALACLVGVLVMAHAYLPPFPSMVPQTPGKAAVTR